MFVHDDTDKNYDSPAVSYETNQHSNKRYAKIIHMCNTADTVDKVIAIRPHIQKAYEKNQINFGEMCIITMLINNLYDKKLKEATDNGDNIH